ncbi:TonB-dependent receptor [candidate division KSB1 bacterium]|nr:TonB-dependent receptor [candidate division KSB1 bacterium]
MNLDFVENVTFSTGGFSARYGDKMSSVLALQMMTNRPRTFESKLTVAATQYGANFETSLGNRGNFIFSARQSYLDLIFKAAGLPFVPIYTDFNIIANYDLSPKDKLFLLGLSAINRVARDQSSFENRTKNAGLLDNSQYQGITGINYQRLVAGGYLDLTFNTNLFRYRLTQIDEFEQQYYKSRADEWEVGAKAQYYWVISKFMGLRSGLSGKSILNKNTTVFADTIYDRSGKRVPLTNFGIVSPVETRTRAQKIAAFTELDWVVTPDLNVNLGVRLDDYNFLNQSAYLAPRLAVKYQIIPRLHLRASGGIYYQSPSFVWVVNPENKNLKALRNQMGVLGLDYTIREDLRVSVESFYKQYRDLPTGVLPGRTDYLVLTNTGTGFGGREDDFQSFGYFNLVSAAKGQAYGFEFLLLKKFSEIPFYGQLGLSYGKSEFTARNGRTYPNQYDQRVIFNLTGGYIFNAKWEIAGKFRYFTGVPYTPVYRPSENPLTPGSIQNLPAEYLTQRLPAGHHLDLRVDRYFNFSNVTLIVYLDIQNIYNFKVPTRPRYEFWEDTISRNNDIGILPSIGISLEL